MPIAVILILNSFILVTLASINNVWGKKSDSSKLSLIIIYGVLFGGSMILLMNLAWGTETGVFYDARTILIAVVSSAYSIYVTIIMVIIGSIYRIYLGGAGTVAGVITIVCTGILGVLFRRYVLPRMKKHIHLSYYLFGLVVHLMMLVYHFALPMDLDFILERIRIISPIILTVYPVMVVILMEIIRANDKRLNMSENLRTSEENFDILFNNMSSGLIYFDENGVFVKCNDRFMEIVSSDRETMIGIDMFELPNPELKKAFLTVMNGKPATFHDYYTSTLSGKELFLHVDFRPAYKDGVFKGGVGIVDDLTESEKLKEEVIRITTIDSLTGLDNRKSFEYDVHAASFTDIYPAEYLMISIDNAQFYIDTLGYDKSDEIIKAFSDILKNTCGSLAKMYRISLNDFAIIYPIRNKETAKKSLRKLKQKIAGIDIATPAVSITTSTIDMNHDTNWYDATNELRNKIFSHRTYTKSKVTANSIDVLMASLFEKSPRERQHSERVSTMSVKVAETFGVSSEIISRLRHAAILHDIGKLNIDLSILDKPGRLTDEEYLAVQSHTESGFRILSAVKEYEDLAKIVLAHHERYDGNGYPFNIKGEEIPFESRIISVVDSYDAMINDRPYRRALSKEKAIEELVNNKGTQFDPEIVDHFIDWIIKEPEETAINQ